MNHQEMIPLFKVHVPEGAISSIEKTLNSGYISEGEKVKEFEESISRYIGCKKILTVNSCTSAITLSLAHAGVGAGDDVVTTPMSCVATNMPILSLGANVVWADVDPETGNITPESFEKSITERTKALCYVHWAGQPADINGIMKIAKARNIKVIEDAAHAFGAIYNGQRIGNHGDYVCFSFQAIKHITTSDGGAIATNNISEEDFSRLLRMRWFGLDRAFARSATKWETDIKEIGYKMHMNDFNATLGIAQMNFVDNIVENHVNNGLMFDSALKGHNSISSINRIEGSRSAYWIYTILLKNADDRDRFVAYMNRKKIATNVVHVRNDQYSVFNKYKKKLPGVDSFCSRMINIPCGWWLSDDDKKRIMEALASYDS
jgi:perosamine synthetase